MAIIKGRVSLKRGLSDFVLLNDAVFILNALYRLEYIIADYVQCLYSIYIATFYSQYKINSTMLLN